MIIGSPCHAGVDAAEAEARASADVHALDLDALRGEPARRLVAGEYGRAGAFGYFDCVADVVAVAVGEEYRVDVGEVRGFGGRERVARKERVDEGF